MTKGRRYEDYIGDGAYVYLTEWGDVVLYTSDGVVETNKIALEPGVLAAFERWRKRVKRACHPEAEEDGDDG